MRSWSPALLLGEQSARRHGDQRAQGQVRLLLAGVAREDGRFDDAVDLVRNAAHLHFGEGWEKERGFIGIALFEAGRYDEAVTEPGPGARAPRDHPGAAGELPRVPRPRAVGARRRPGRRDRRRTHGDAVPARRGGDVAALARRGPHDGRRPAARRR
ncbi:hypothetical protein GCM10025868_19140 [Angustibacter aerolatus]|uniref:MalT-like TPR region domain-containing protein n=1 Tax=Angustibacter aerolatus TaxID=1162965 RepID=A0ABQ6JH19_9ACTN|nr:hypothetical protein GCM10025868_19140 [Angustibacter aerolatus]